MGFTPEIAQARFGTGQAPGAFGPVSVGDIIRSLARPDPVVQRYPIASFTERYRSGRLFAKLRRQVAAGTVARPELRQARRAMLGAVAQDLRHTLVRGVLSAAPMQERLAWFWADHFTVSARQIHLKAGLVPFVEEAIRPHITGRFGDLLVAAATHPAMVLYLDQNTSVGPNSAAGRRREGRGLNENLAREILELHSLGVSGAYTQGDVRNFALLLTGLTLSNAGAQDFRPPMSEPGRFSILGRAYGNGKARLSDIEDALWAMARHPDTATHIARKLAVHFVADMPPPALVADMAATYRDTDGDLSAVYATLLNHPAAWAPELQKVRQPFEFLVASAKALGFGQALTGASVQAVRDRLMAPLAQMGQPWLEAPGPDGWPEEASAWITPQALAARVDWAMTGPSQWLPALPDPRVVLDQVVGARASDRLRFAVQAAETRAAGIGLILAAPEFQRR